MKSLTNSQKFLQVNPSRIVFGGTPKMVSKGPSSRGFAPPCCFAPPFSSAQGLGGGGRGGTHTHTHTVTHTHTHTGTRTGTYTRMLHLPFSDLPLKKCPNHLPCQRCLPICQFEANFCDGGQFLVFLCFPLFYNTTLHSKRTWPIKVRLFIILFVRNFWRVCSQFWPSVRNSV